jgi:hypothetical protein
MREAKVHRKTFSQPSELKLKKSINGDGIIPLSQLHPLVSNIHPRGQCSSSGANLTL